METKLEGVLVVSEKNRIVAIVYKDQTTHQNVFYKVEEMSVDEIADLLKSKAPMKHE